jgi:hypothetical protein
LQTAKDHNLAMHVKNTQMDFSISKEGSLVTKYLTTLCKSVGVAKHHFPGANDDFYICLRGRLDRISVVHAIIQKWAQKDGTNRKMTINDHFETVFVGQVPSSCNPTSLLHAHNNVQLESEVKFVYGDVSLDRRYKQIRISGCMWNIEKVVALILQAINTEMGLETNTPENDPQVCFY